MSRAEIGCIRQSVARGVFCHSQHGRVWGDRESGSGLFGGWGGQGCHFGCLWGEVVRAGIWGAGRANLAWIVGEFACGERRGRGEGLGLRLPVDEATVWGTTWQEWEWGSRWWDCAGLCWAGEEGKVVRLQTGGKYAVFLMGQIRQGVGIAGGRA